MPKLISKKGGGLKPPKPTPNKNKEPQKITTPHVPLSELKRIWANEGIDYQTLDRILSESESEWTDDNEARKD